MKEVDKCQQWWKKLQTTEERSERSYTRDKKRNISRTYVMRTWNLKKKNTLLFNVDEDKGSSPWYLYLVEG